MSLIKCPECGTAGFLLDICMLISGIVGISTRNSKSKTGAIIAGVIYLFGALIGFCNVGTYSDLQIWSFLTLCFGVFFIICAIRTKKIISYKAQNETKNHSFISFWAIFIIGIPY